MNVKNGGCMCRKLEACQNSAPALLSASKSGCVKTLHRTRQEPYVALIPIDYPN